MRAHGFSLIEMAFVLIIVTLLLGGLLVPFTTQIEQKRTAETQKALEEINEALVGFAMANRRLPCPAISASNGNEQTILPCPGAGFLPWATLGVNRQDAWGRLFYYKVTPAYTASATPFTLGTATNQTIYTRDQNGNSVQLSRLNGIVAVVISFGKNGYGGTHTDGSAVVAAAASTDENTNRTSTTNSYSRIPTGPRSPCDDNTANLCEFDDLLTWVSPNVLFNRMVAAGRLP